MKLKDWMTPQTIITLLAIFAIVIGYKFTLEATAEQVKVNTERITCVEKDTTILKTEVPKIQEDVKEIKDAVIVIQQDIKLVLRNLNKINGNQ